MNWTDPDEQHRVGSQGQLGSVGLGTCRSPPIHRIWIWGRHPDVLQVPVQPSGLGELLLDPKAATARIVWEGPHGEVSFDPLSDVAGRRLRRRPAQQSEQAFIGAPGSAMKMEVRDKEQRQ